MFLDVGDEWPLTVTVRAAPVAPATVGVPTNATTIVLTITEPDGVVVTPAVVNPPAVTGVYKWDHVLTKPGRHTARWESTGPKAAYTEVANVGPITPTGIVSLDDAKEHLNITTSDSDEELRRWIEAITTIIEDGDGRKFAGVGPVVNRTVVETVPGGSMLILSKTPVVSITTVVGAHGVTAEYDEAALYLDSAHGHVRPSYGSTFWPGWLTVTYIAGRGGIVPPAIIEAALIVLKNMWETQRGASGRPRQGSDDAPQLTTGYLLPYRALALLGAYENQLPAFG